MSKRAHEKAIFEAFMRLAPEFAGEVIVEWSQPTQENDFPDVVCKTKSGRRIGVELGEWLNESEMSASKSMERIQDSVLAAVGEHGSNNTENIYFIWLHPKPKVRIKPEDAVAFRRELFACVADCDRRWPAERFWHSPQGHHVVGDEIAKYPVLAKYLSGVRLFPREAYRGWPPDGRSVKRDWPAGIDWIGIPARGGAYSEDTMLQPLVQLLSEKKTHYATAGTGFDHLSLVVYYNQALMYNSPPETAQFKLEDVAAAATAFLDGDQAPFQSVFLFVAVDSGRVLRIC